MRRSPSAICWPTLRSLAATTTWASAGVAVEARARRTAPAMVRLTKRATTIANIPSTKSRLRFIVPPTAPLIRVIEIPELCRTLQGVGARHPKPCKDREIIHRVGVIDCHDGRAHGSPARRGNAGSLVDGHASRRKRNAVLRRIGDNFGDDAVGLSPIFLNHRKPGSLTRGVVQHLVGADQT